jgi:hypothetical protein
MKKEILDVNYKGEVINHDPTAYTDSLDYLVKVIERHVEKSKNNLKGSPIVVAGGYGVGSKENFALIYKLADVLCTLTFQFGDKSVANLVGTSLFADGTAAVLMVGEEHPLYKDSQFKVLNGESFF